MAASLVSKYRDQGGVGRDVGNSAGIAAFYVRSYLRGHTMLKWALIFLAISVVSGILGFSGVSAATARIAKILFVLALLLFIAFLIAAYTIAGAVL